MRCETPALSLFHLVGDPSRRAWRDQEAATRPRTRVAAQATGSAYAHRTSWQLAHDVEALRVALGEEWLHYLGNSYGIYGQTYAELFPDRVGRMYLDGVTDYTQPGLAGWLACYALTHERQLTRFRDWCEVAARAERGPLPKPGRPGSGVLTLGEPRVGMPVGMNPPRQAMLAGTRDGGVTTFATELGEPEPEPPGTVRNALLCHDFLPDVPGFTELRGMERRLRELARGSAGCPRGWRWAAASASPVRRRSRRGPSPRRGCHRS
ncbi:alpha/beta hydrolase fold [Amycolatopsis arida]|uniref:Alpha/beta hydrolase fold n=1 Tax=Amycolatopsis arida TaxID=587909 RepID=A0A1I5WX36_9PSEU|nr:alpha/beta hydrolase family protein [Amycolatopsis arida]SFQ24191.1 alpha/beta hydrolase fold [Amycolatopsis arida]